jgi:hypothetical protein
MELFYDYKLRELIKIKENKNKNRENKRIKIREN